VSTVNGGITAMVRTMAIELAPIRVNALHPGVVGDSPYWIDKHEMLERVKARTPTGRLVTMQDIVDASVALLENPAINGVDLYVDGGWVLL
jgi:NAD(P)-dependent dehydrogenase (short-subunit alcohol dehydrogenase family)